MLYNGKNIIRVFPHKNNHIPDDEDAYVGYPPAKLLNGDTSHIDEVHISVTFTWDRELGERLARVWGMFFDNVKLGGPLYETPETIGNFVPGLYTKKGILITSRGCVRNCPWCFVPKREGKIRELPITEGWILQDNNILACSHEHQEAVYAKMSESKKRLSFPGGIDTRLFDDWATEQFRKLHIEEIFLAADTDGMLKPLEAAVKKLDFLMWKRRRCYVMIGYGGETIEKAAARLMRVYELGCLPFSQLYIGPEHREVYSKEWRNLNRGFSRPATSVGIMREAAELEKFIASTRKLAEK